MTNWNPDLYLKFEKERTQPAIDLAARVELDDPREVADIGCGPGNSTRVLRDRWPAARILGVDSSPDMIHKAREAYPQGEWELAAAANWRADRPMDLIFSSATIQWIADQEALLRNLFGQLATGGALAVQVPANDESPLHRGLYAVAQREPWRARMEGCSQALHYHPPERFYGWLCALTSRVSLWRTEYFHILTSHQEFIDWYSSTGMRTFLDRLATEEEQVRFKRDVLEACRLDYPPQADGKILFPFRRTFFIAYR